MRPAAASSAPGQVVPLRIGGHRPAVIAFHPVGGRLAVYATLARHLPEDLPVYGVEGRPMRDGENELADLDAMVGAYTAALRKATRPPYRLFGFSLGGYLAARAAETLERDGETVELVGVIDWDARPRATLAAQREALLRVCVAMYRFLARDIGALRPLSDARLHDELAAVVDRVTGERSARPDLFFEWVSDRGLVVSDALWTRARRYLADFAQHCAMLSRDLPHPRFVAPLVVWRATEGFGSPLESWRHAGTIALEHVIDGDHFACLRPPAVVTLARQLDEFLRQHAGVERANARRAG